MASSEFDLPDPFDALDNDWRAICRRHRRSGIPQHWAAEAALAQRRRLDDVIPPPGIDREQVSASIARLCRDGDDLAGRTLLQLCMPGLVQLAARWQQEIDRRNLAAWEVVTRARIYLARLQRQEISCNGSVAGHLVWSIHRDLVSEAQRSRQRPELRGSLYDLENDAVAVMGPSAEDHVIGGEAVMVMLQDGAARGALQLPIARVLAHIFAGSTVGEACDRSQVLPARFYRNRTGALAFLRQQILSEAM